MRRPKIGAEFSCWYPSCNKISVPLEWVRRTILVTDVCDYTNDRMDPALFLKRPLCRRGSILIYGTDLICGGERKFWLEACRGQEPATLRLGLYCEGESFIDWIARDYAPTRFDRHCMFDEIKRYQAWATKHEDVGLKLGVFRAEMAA